MLLHHWRSNRPGLVIRDKDWETAGDVTYHAITWCRWDPDVSLIETSKQLQMSRGECSFLSVSLLRPYHAKLLYTTVEPFVSCFSVVSNSLPTIDAIYSSRWAYKRYGTWYSFTRRSISTLFFFVCRTAYQSLHKASNQARSNNQVANNGLTHSWIEYYRNADIRSNQIYVNEWNQMDDLLSHRSDSPHLYQP